MKIGTKAPTMRVPCILKNQTNLLSLSEFHGQIFALCWVPHIREFDAWFLETQVKKFEQAGSALAILVSKDNGLGRDWVRPPHEFSLTFFIDPIGRLQRTFTLSQLLFPTRCETLIFDQGTCLRFRLIHDLNLKGFSAVLDIAESDFLEGSQENGFPPAMGNRSWFQTMEPKAAIETPS
ncbi:MAG: hypothetical protein KC592_10610 [Nitrospira sp.]|nr:hypothetical protein [Nitrospira sp.]